jgi:capsule polysaccharide export protein KpsE/RkpR
MSSNRIPNQFLFLLLQNRWFLLKALLVVMIPTVIVTYLLSKSYTVTTLIMPPESQPLPSLSIGGLASGDFAGFFGGGMGYALPLMTTLSDVYSQILESRTLIELVILSTGYLEDQDLLDKYNQNNALGLYWARKRFRNNYSVNVTPSGFIRISVTTSDPLYSVEISARVIALLDSINADINTSRLEITRRLIERQYASADSMLLSASRDLLFFKDTSGVVELGTETAELVTLLMTTKGIYLEIQASAQAIRSGLAHGSNAMLYQLDRQADATREVIDLLERGEVPSFGDDVGFNFSLDEIPELAIEYAKLRTNYDISLTMSNMLRIQLEQAIVQETMVEETIRILDPPGHPGWKSKPKRLYIWIEVFLVASFFLVGYVQAKYRISEMKRERPEAWGPWGKLLKDIGGDFKRKRRPGS